MSLATSFLFTTVIGGMCFYTALKGKGMNPDWMTITGFVIAGMNFSCSMFLAALIVTGAE